MKSGKNTVLPWVYDGWKGGGGDCSWGDRKSNNRMYSHDLEQYQKEISKMLAYVAFDGIIIFFSLFFSL